MITITHENKTAVVTLAHGKVNAISHGLITALRDTFLSLTQDKNIDGIILTGPTGAFSAGLDVMEQAAFSVEQATAFWVTYFEALQAMVRYPKPFVCAITGFAPAGATILTLCADYRIMAEGPKHVIGMHEFSLSMQVPEMMLDIWAYTLGETKAYQSLQTAKLFHAQEARKENIVQQTAPPEEVLERAKKHLSVLTNVHPAVFQESKRLARKNLLAIVDRDVNRMANEFVQFTNQPELKAMVAAFAQRLSSKK